MYGFTVASIDKIHQMPGSHSGNGPAYVLMAVMALCVAALGASAVAGSRWLSVLAVIASVGIAVQTLHTFEHVAQFGYWLSHPTEKPWMTSLGMSIHTSFVHLGLKPPEAIEVMHIFGNGIFLAGVLALWLLIRHLGSAVPAPVRTGARWAVMLETMHLAEHAALTITVFTNHKPIGLSTGFGLIDTGPALWSYRIIWHLLMNAIPFTVVVISVVRWKLAGREEVQRVPALTGA